ncbi:histidine kinase dimerization/phospho-acceptor domain-containing protein [Wielerella bovis]|uniref:histidine kinase dimerization/phospho-acceptor domain-containing protein n=1 Tax=Wielerella bovis TaxID=2917790 RepID=UPI002018E84C|nr:histidine kinase dimerization/phospho-acceptor domain-containing protein [Wielerella bovis]MCG7656100.1 ATP-binding protein [Wielerella bovis]MCG7658325.1 ATP-binding protein [Wielerella bovis]
MLKYFKHISLRLFFILLGISTLLTAWAWFNHQAYIHWLIGLNLLVLATLAWWLARSINRIRDYAEAMAANRIAQKPQFGDSYLYRLVNAIAHLRDELNHRQHIENYVLGLTHELKTPLTAQQAALELLQDSELSAEQQQLVSRILRNSQKQQQLITQLLELARLENCDSLQTMQTVDLLAISQQAAQDCETNCQAKQLQICVAAEQTYCLQGDPVLLRQAVDNLLYNALDFATAHSQIHIGLLDTPEKIHLYVDNQGEHIPDYALNKIPQRFYSLPRANGRRSSGLGLNFVSEIMRLHHGDLILSNQQNGVRATLVFTKNTD